MAVDIGLDAVDLPTDHDAALYTIINREHPAEAGGTLQTIEIWAHTNMTGLIVGTFYTTNGNTLKCRDSEAIAGTITAGSKVYKAVTLTVEIGDYIGLYWTGGAIEVATSGYAGYWLKTGKYIDPNDETTYTLFATRTVSLGGHFEVIEVGWTGKISGVTNPAKIMGVDVANIAKVKGVS